MFSFLTSFIFFSYYKKLLKVTIISEIDIFLNFYKIINQFYF